jgi:hypothetical protein
MMSIVFTTVLVFVGVMVCSRIIVVVVDLMWRW